MGSFNSRIFFSFSLRRQQIGMDVGDHTAVHDVNIAQQFIEFFVITDGQHDVSGDDTHLFVVSACVTGEFEDFGSEVFEDRCKVDGGADSDALSELPFFEVAVEATDGEG
uniref:Uncharacterized protein n=1 Tax=Arcella intermedia TaxID=1963864 RepID=A0A6B2LQA7_9EUKA